MAGAPCPRCEQEMAVLDALAPEVREVIVNAPLGIPAVQIVQMYGWEVTAHQVRAIVDSTARQDLRARYGPDHPQVEQAGDWPA